MLSISEHVESKARGVARPSTGKKLLQAAALAAVLVPLGSVTAEAATIICGTSAQEGNCGEETGSYSPSGALLQSNTWKFYLDPSDLTTLLYWITIEGIPTSTFELDVRDVVVTQTELIDTEALSAFPGATCIPTFGPSLCGLFDVTIVDASNEPTWLDGYYMQINWFTNQDLASQPPDNGRNRILQATGQGKTIFDDALSHPFYDPQPTPDDPAIGGRGDVFSRFGAFANVPEPGMLILFAAGAVAGIYRNRRRLL
ncbi:MAG: PEP-CTERM sorting domain-containing protein [Acidobacteria bacterium]|nr:PEP-CTERM sorting domain-containing protein [Acidobacteriota bacterium]